MPKNRLRVENLELRFVNQFCGRKSSPNSECILSPRVCVKEFTLTRSSEKKERAFYLQGRVTIVTPNLLHTAEEFNRCASEQTQFTAGFIHNSTAMPDTISIGLKMLLSSRLSKDQ